MPQLLVNNLAGGGQIELYFVVTNTTIRYRVAGATPAEQGDALNALGNAMTDSEQATIEILPQVINPWPNGYTNDTVAAQLFQQTDALYVEGEELFAAPAEEVLWDVLEACGAALLEVFI